MYWDSSFLIQQQEAFRTQIKWAKEKKLPIVIHCRDAFDEIFEILEQEKGGSLRGIFHCFTGTKNNVHYIKQNIKCIKCVNWNLMSTSSLLSYDPPKKYPCEKIMKLRPIELTFDILKNVFIKLCIC